ncbi:ABC transporter, CydDC cysteine exporter (CydDC-E) family, permease/ATP-binding protein CydC [Geobacter metallireducens RCH3]|uniref:Thiol reductant ABC exporter, ATP-binding protein CydC n=1 Tax=Geobacter metallireducens (strain ATCC 53774 / DSM 7210 / GS-15) TaxID=269799 RepID=Q39SC2_GEOMG|nr:thiol reductant ABC exporter subunit CydC [Geobacter metallireducens]ABB32852.1 thiol reductant ABC exporter, ATP-binding protein CydC [Geobacter metallireducens GS-15]EHP89015.1 ABC transporter, CydDC cysteine exporter (CydDC-E) family, permease/ATP-binding protein CydC [Geobacter metallireducens RCH3]
MRELFRILAVSRRQWPWMVTGILLGVAVIAANTALMALSGWFIASMAVTGATAVPFNYFFPAAAIRALAILRTVGRYAERLVTHEAAFRILADLRVWLFRRLEPLAPAGLERYAGGDVAGRLRADVDALESLYLRIVAPLVTGAAAIVLAVLVAARWSVPAALALLAFLLVAGVALPLAARRLAQEPGRRSAELSGALRTAVTEGLLGAEELILLGAAERQAERVDHLSSRLVAEQERLAAIGGLTLAGGVACGGLGVAAVLAAGSVSVAAGLVSGPALVMLVLFTAAAFEAAAGMPAALQLVPSAREAVRRIRELADAPVPVPDPPAPEPLPVGTGIAFHNVSSAYDPALPVLHGFSLEVPAGEKVALAGPSGVGKSTVAEVLLRFRGYAGSVTVGGMEISHLAADELRGLIAAVPQRPHLFNATIRENIMVGNPAAGDAELRRALKDAGLAAWVDTLPLGLDTPVGEGGSAVSGGEARRIALARALVKDAPILVLDEPTEGLDAAAEREVVARLAARTEGKTVLVITHRPACFALANRVVRMGKN